jgi:hypothetical protein
METAATERASALQTAGAIPLALVTWMIVSVLATVIWYFMNVFFTVIRPEIIGFIANAIGGFIGVIAAKALTDHWLPRAARKPVAIAFFGFCAFLLFLEWGYLPNPSHPVIVTAGVVSSTWAAYQAFWLGVDLS